MKTIVLHNSLFTIRPSDTHFKVITNQNCLQLNPTTKILLIMFKVLPKNTLKCATTCQCVSIMTSPSTDS